MGSKRVDILERAELKRGLKAVPFQLFYVTDVWKNLSLKKIFLTSRLKSNHSF